MRGGQLFSLEVVVEAGAGEIELSEDRLPIPVGSDELLRVGIHPELKACSEQKVVPYNAT